MNVQIELSWKDALSEEFDKPYFQNLVSQLRNDKVNRKVIYPPGSLIFNAFSHTPLDKVKVVIIGQDPYHGEGQAMGLAFSVPRHIRRPPSLVNVFKEMKADLGIEISEHGDLTHWAKQGVLLLNSFLTVEKGRPGSHKKYGWASFTDAVIKYLSDHREGIIFLLWGNFAQKKGASIDETKHYILKAAHPSPLAGNRFSGCGHFSKTNAILREQGLAEIDWTLNKEDEDE